MYSASPWSVCDDVVGVRKVLVLGGSGAGKSLSMLSTTTFTGLI